MKVSIGPKYSYSISCDLYIIQNSFVLTLDEVSSIKTEIFFDYMP